MRWKIGNRVYEKITVEEWDRLSEGRRSILSLEGKGIVFVRIVK